MTSNTAAAKCSPLATVWEHPYRRESYDAKRACGVKVCDRYTADPFAIFADTVCTKM